MCTQCNTLSLYKENPRPNIVWVAESIDMTIPEPISEESNVTFTYVIDCYSSLVLASHFFNHKKGALTPLVTQAILAYGVPSIICCSPLAQPDQLQLNRCCTEQLISVITINSCGCCPHHTADLFSMNMYSDFIINRLDDTSLPALNNAWHSWVSNYNGNLDPLKMTASPLSRYLDTKGDHSDDPYPF